MSTQLAMACPVETSILCRFQSTRDTQQELEEHETIRQQSMTKLNSAGERHA